MFSLSLSLHLPLFLFVCNYYDAVPPKEPILVQHLVRAHRLMRKLVKLEWVRIEFSLYLVRVKIIRLYYILAVTTKVTQGAKTFGSFLYSAVNKAGAKIKETVKDNVSSKDHHIHTISILQFIPLPFFCFISSSQQNILGEFSKEQEAFIKGQQSVQSGVVPWTGHQNEEKVKEEIISLSSVMCKIEFTCLQLVQ